MNILWAGFFVLLLMINPAQAADQFNDQIQPILKANCLPCHDEATQASAYSVKDLDSVLAGGARHGEAVKAGQPANSPLVQVLRSKIKPLMPLGKPALPESEIAAIEQWIRELKPKVVTVSSSPSSFWAFVKPKQHEVPKVQKSGWARNGIDNFILSKLEENGLSPASEAERRVLIRRLYFDLIGLPPTPEEVKTFVESTAPTAYEELVDRLLQDPRYGERWGRRWLDLARYADTTGYEQDAEYFNTWRYRDYVVDAFNKDTPYDKFIQEQIAGSDYLGGDAGSTVLHPPDPEKVVAQTFLRLAPFTEPRGERSRHELLSEMTSTVGSVFLGLTVGCAQCHNHKYDNIPTKDFYRMKAFFATVYIPPPRAGDVNQVGGPEPAEFYRPGEKERMDQARAKYKEELETAEKEFAAFYKPLLERLAAEMKTPSREEKPAERKEKAKEATLADLRKAILGLGDMSTYRVTFTPAEVQRFTEFNRQILRLKNSIVRLEPVATSLRSADSPPYGLSVPTTYVLERGEWDRPREPVEPGFLSAITGHSEPAKLVSIDRYMRNPGHGRRRTLAEWIGSPDNPLTARVMVNRLWHYHFGRGIVETTSDFGKNGIPPTHPELLDWLALRFVEEKWSIKAMHRLMVTSSAYRQSSHSLDPKAEGIDSQNRLLWRFNRQRLEGEAIRDSVLAISGRLNLAQGGPPVFPPLPEGLDKELLTADDINMWETSPEPDALKRSIYVFQRRSLSVPILETFDAPVLTTSCSRRGVSTTPLQALAMYDGLFVNTEVQYFARRVQTEGGPTPEGQIRRAFQVVFGRSPTVAEVKRSLGLFNATRSQEEALGGLCRVLLNSNEFVYVD